VQSTVSIDLLQRGEVDTAPYLDTPVATAPATSEEPATSLLAWILAAFLGGLALNLTPCVYPLIPITIGYFARQGKGDRRRTILLACLYILSMAVVYAILGSAAALTGAMFGSFLQNTSVLVGIAAVMVVFAAGMMGAFEIRLPASLNRLTAAKPGPGGAVMMGATVGLVAAPCVGPFIATLLAYVGARGNPAEGFLLFLALGLGLGAPYLPLAVLSGRLSSWPSAGPFLVAAKRLLGLALLGLATWFLLPILGTRLFQLVFSAILVVGGGATLFWKIEGESSGTQLFRRLAALLLIIGGIGILGREPSGELIEWSSYSRAELAIAAETGQPAIVDVYADWCLPCHELEAITFADEAVREAFDGMRLLKADVTGPVLSPDVQELMTREGIQGVPTILFYDAAGRERQDLRLVGFEGPTAFKARLDALREGRPRS
jgi:thiol:disulfide interchange protein DsbD